MGSIFKPKMPPLPPVQPAPEPPPAVPEEISAEEKEAIAKEQAAVERKRRGRKSTILTSPLGVQESKEEQLETLLGK
tara:strand:- start:244 stop:474 length:231 start_codon:yes stop_codon:yes gene_type:complete